MGDIIYMMTGVADVMVKISRLFSHSFVWAFPQEKLLRFELSF